jgi:hypothetical protein
MATPEEVTVKRNSTTVAFAALLALGALAGPAAAAGDRNIDSGPPQQGMQGTAANANVQANPQANYQADYHADYSVKTGPDKATPGNDPRADLQRERLKPRDPFGTRPPGWPR